jgi:hypothetical protein
VFRSGAVIWEQRIAYHEAGHAVIGWVLGYRIVAVRLARKGKYGGMTDFGRCTHGLRSAIWSARKVCPQIEAALDVVISLAGRQAEELIAPGAADGGSAGTTACTLLKFCAPIWDVTASSKLES